MSKFYWIFLNRATKVQSRKMSQRRAERLVAGLNISEISPWWAWNPTLTEWIPLKNIVAVEGKRVRLVLRPENNQKRSDDTETVTVQGFTESEIKVKQALVEKLLEREAKEEELFYSSIHIDGLREERPEEEFNGDDLQLQKQHPGPPSVLKKNKYHGSERRGTNRVEMRIQVLLVASGKIFKTYSDNVSLTGVLLEKPVPEVFQKSSFEVVLIVKRGLKEDKIVFLANIVGDRTDPRRVLFFNPGASSIRRLEQILKEYIATLKELKRTS